jgi:hypothetical protein
MQGEVGYCENILHIFYPYGIVMEKGGVYAQFW